MPAADASDAELRGGRLVTTLNRPLPGVAASPPGARAGSWPWRRWLSAVLLVAGGMLAAIAMWEKRILEDEDTFVATTLPLIRDASVQTRLAHSLADQVNEAIIDDNRLIVDFYQVAARMLEDFGFGSGEAILSELDIPPNIGLLVVATRAEYTLAWWVIENFRPLTEALALLALVALVGSVGFASNRPRAVIAVGGALGEAG